MLICPDCNLKLNDSNNSCDHCAWQLEENEGILKFLGKIDKSNPTLGNYFDNYDVIAERDLNNSILTEKYLEHQSSNLARLVKFDENSKICDIGCGKGFLIKSLIERGVKRITAVDISLAYLKKLKMPEITKIQANAEKLPFFEEFDLIVSTDVLEHVLNMGSFLYCVNRALKDNGLVYIRVPYRENLTLYSQHFGCPYDFVHLRTFNRQNLADCMRFSGFKALSFHIDGFSLYSPQEFWMKGPKRREWYNKLQSWTLKKVRNPEDVTKWYPHFARMFMRPTEVTVVAKKIKKMEKQNYWET